MRLALSIVAATAALIALPTLTPAEDNADLAAYIESIRTSGMSEGAQMQIRSIANIVAGASHLTYREDPESGRYWGSYMSATCPNPNADAPELNRWKTMKTDDSAAMTEKLKPFADADASGFVTTKEGTDFRFLLEFGYLAEQAMREHGATLESVALAAGTEPAATDTRLRDYVALRNRIAQAGIDGLPEVALK